MKESLYNIFGLNKKIFLIINNYTHKTILFPHILYVFSLLFDISIFGMFYILGCVYLFYIITKAHEDHRYQLLKRKFYHLFRCGIIYIIFGLSYALLKFTINLPRPYCSLDGEIFFTIIDVMEVRCLSSFPSSHAGLAVLFCYMIFPYCKFNYRVPLMVIICLLVGISRISLSMHYPMDIVYGYIIAILLIFAGNLICSSTVINKLYVFLCFQIYIRLLM